MPKWISAKRSKTRYPSLPSTIKDDRFAFEPYAIENINSDVNLTQTHSQCIAFEEKAKRFLNDKFDAKKEIPRLLENVLVKTYVQTR